MSVENVKSPSLPEPPSTKSINNDQVETIRKNGNFLDKIFGKIPSKAKDSVKLQSSSTKIGALEVLLQEKDEHLDSLKEKLEQSRFEFEERNKLLVDELQKHEQQTCQDAEKLKSLQLKIFDLMKSHSAMELKNVEDERKRRESQEKLSHENRDLRKENKELKATLKELAADFEKQEHDMQKQLEEVKSSASDSSPNSVLADWLVIYAPDESKLKILKNKFVELEKLCQRNSAKGVASVKANEESGELKRGLEDLFGELRTCAADLQQHKGRPASKKELFLLSKSTLKFDGKIGSKRDFIVKNVTAHRIAYFCCGPAGGSSPSSTDLPVSGILNANEERLFSVQCAGDFLLGRVYVNAVRVPKGEGGGEFRERWFHDDPSNVQIKLISCKNLARLGKCSLL